MNWKGRRVLVTGAGGFIGSHLTERLVAEGARTRAFVHYNALGTWGWLDSTTIKSDIEVFHGDICDLESLREPFKDTEVVFHLAALIAIPYSYRAPRSYVRTNVEGTLNVLEAARAAGVQRMVHTSTSEVYGTARIVPIPETHPLNGQSPYAASKIGADQLANSYHCSFGLPVATIRPFNTYGPRQSARAVIPTIISQALAGRQVNLGNLSPTRDLCYVDDTVEGFLRVASSEHTVGRVTNIGTGVEISIGDLSNLILNLTDRHVSIMIDEGRRRPTESEVERLCADVSDCERLLSWRPKTSLEAGLRRTIAWVSENQDRFRATTYAT